MYKYKKYVLKKKGGKEKEKRNKKEMIINVY